MIVAWELPVLISFLIRTKLNRYRCFHLCHYPWAQTLGIRWTAEPADRSDISTYGEKWDEFRHSWHSATPDLGLSRYRRISWHWFQGLRHDSYLDINFVIIRSHVCCRLLRCWYLGNYHAWDLETSVSLCADVDLTPNPGSPNVTNVETHLISNHITHVRGSAVQLIPDVWAQV